MTRSDTGATADILIATDPDHCPMLEVGTPASQTAPSENIAPDRDYGFGAPGVCYFAYENPFTIDANGVVSDSGVRKPLDGGGLAAMGAATNYASPAHAASSDWASSAGAIWGATGASLPGLPPPDAATSDGTNSYPRVYPPTTIDTVSGETIYLHFIAELSGPSGSRAAVLLYNANTGYLYPRVLFYAGTGNIAAVAPTTLEYSHFEAGAGPNGGDLIEVVASAPADTGTCSLYCYPDDGNTDQKTLWVHHAYVGREFPSRHALLHPSSGTAAASRSADVARPRRRLPAAFTLRLAVDASALLADGDFLTFEGGGFFGIRGGAVVLSDGATERGFDVWPAAGVLDFALAVDEDEALLELLDSGARYRVSGPFGFADRYAYVGPLAPVRKLYLWPGKAARPGEFTLAAAA